LEKKSKSQEEISIKKEKFNFRTIFYFEDKCQLTHDFIKIFKNLIYSKIIFRNLNIFKQILNYIRKIVSLEVLIKSLNDNPSRISIVMHTNIFSFLIKNVMEYGLYCALCA